MTTRVAAVMRSIRPGPRLRTALRWCASTVLLATATFIMHSVRGDIDQAHVVLVYLLLVLGASATGGRALGLVLAVAAFALVDYYFQKPFDTLSVGKPLDWLVLFAFLATATVATQLLARARAEAEEARRRTVEVSSLARIGSETLSAGPAEEALARIVEVVRATLGVARCMVYALDADGRFGSCVGSDGVHPEAGTPPDVVQRVASSGEAASLRAADDTIRELAFPLRAPLRLVGVLRIADERPIVLDQAHQRFLDALTYYAALALERVRLVAEAEHAQALREADRLRESLLASVSHDLRTPLTTIKALAESAALDGDERAIAIEEQADRLARLVSDLLDLSRIKGNALHLAPEINTAEDLIGAVVRQARGLARGRRVETNIDLDSPALVGCFDFVQAVRILGNLLENALRHSPDREPVEISASRDGGELVFVVADRGPGVAAEDAELIFEPFYRRAKMPSDSGHAGLGLSIARRLAELHGGSVRYQPRSGGGSIFTLRLPAADPVDPGVNAQV